MPTSNLIWCDELCRSLNLYGVFTKRGWRRNVPPDPEKWRAWVNHRHGTPLEEIETFSY